MVHFYENLTGYASMQEQGKLLNLILSNLPLTKIRIAEIGVYMGRGTALWNVELINQNRDYEYYAIDHFRGSAEHIKTIDYYSITLENLKCFENNLKIIKNSSVDESKKYPDNYFDIVYLDASHDYQSVKDDILAWFPKIKNGGYICGDDYIAGWPGVVKAVDEVLGRISRVGGQQWYGKK